jgi:hypothetical protein
MNAHDPRYWGWQNPTDPDNEIEVTRALDIWDRGPELITLSISEEQAMDSYNSTFTCSVRLDDATARALRDHLSQLLDGKP